TVPPAVVPRETPIDPDAPDPAAHQTALDRFRLSEEAVHDQRARELDDLRFVDEKGAQWDDDIKRLRGGQDAGSGLPAVPARPCLEFNLLRGPVQQVINTARQAKLGLSFAPEGEGASQLVAQAYDDIARAIQADSRAHLARQWAFERAAKCGFGVYRILTEYVNTQTFDQRIIYKRVLNQASAYLDPFAQEPDWSDGQFALLTQDLPLARYKRAHPTSTLAAYSDRELTALGDDIPQWITTSHGDAGVGVRVAEYWEVREETDVLVLLPDNTTAREAEIPATILAQVERDRGAKLPRRTVTRGRRVFWSLINGVEILQGPQEWNGAYIPIIPVIGDEANLNGDRRWTGIVQFARDAQQSYNYMRSAQVEAVGLAPRAQWLIADGQLEGYEAWWQQANTRNLPYLPYRLTTYSGGQAPPPSRNVAEPAIQAVTLAAAAAKDDLHGTTNMPPVSLGQLDPHERSGVAIRALQGQAEVGSSGYLDNLASVSMAYEGKVLKDLIPRVYDRPGRVVPALGLDDKRRSLMVNIPFVEEGGQPRAVPPGTPGAQQIALAGAELSVTATVGKSYATRREETAAAITAVMQAAPGLAPILAPYWLDELDFPGAKKLAAIAKKTLPPQFQQDEGQGQGPNPAQLQQQLAQAQQLIELLTKALQEKTQQIETDQVKADAQLQQTQLELASQERIATLNAQVDVLKAELSAQGAKASTTVGALASLDRAALTAQAGTERALWQGVMRSVQQLDQQAFLKEQQAAQLQAEREAQEAARAQQAQGPGPGAGGPPGAGAMEPGGA
ncbi:MAG TPA: portal protein, partial [Burkholderiaceae bacterium]|nr:portal protein [Burkholderiaceae bacterium]